MNIDRLIFLNSLVSSLFIPLHGEYGWFAAVMFGGYNVYLITALAVAGALGGTMINFGLGYLLSKHEKLHASGGIYAKAAYYFRFAVVLLLFPQLWITGALAFFAGLMRVPVLLTMAMALAGRIGYYGYYLSQH